MSASTASILNFNIDNYINPIIPRNRLSRLPYSVSRFLGYRHAPPIEPPRLLVHLWSFLGAFIGILTVSALSIYAPGLAKYHPPTIIASLVCPTPKT